MNQLEQRVAELEVKVLLQEIRHRVLIQALSKILEEEKNGKVTQESNKSDQERAD